MQERTQKVAGDHRNRIGLFLALTLCLLGGGCEKEGPLADDDPGTPAVQSAAKALERVVVSEAARTLLYLPLYHAEHRGFFREQALDVDIVTGGTATNAFAAMLSGEAQFAVADPMYVPISREKGSKTKVVAQIVGRIAVWILSKDPDIKELNREALKKRKISTHVRPMTAYTYAVRTIRELGLEPGRDVEVLENMPGAEIVPLLSGQADFAATIEPQVTRAVAQGAHVVLSYPKLLGDQVFTGLMAREDYIEAHAKAVEGIVRAIQKALVDIRADRRAALASAKEFFPQLEERVLVDAMDRIVEEGVLPRSVSISEESWNKAIRVRVEAGDLKTPSPREQNCLIDLMTKVAGVPDTPR